MPIVNRIADFAADMTAWRRHLHMHPELRFDCHDTARFVADRLRDFGVDEIHEGIGETGIVALIHGRAPGDTVGLRADMDALPIAEATGVDWASRVPGRMHACGHDGHTTMLLGAARYLAETRNFAGRVALIFQPAEEGGGGAAAMVAAGMMERFAIREVHALHNGPGMAAGQIGLREGPMLAAYDIFDITVRGRGAHAAQPHNSVDPLACAVAIWSAIQTVSSRNLDALDNAVISVPVLTSGTSHIIIEDTARLAGTLRTLQREARQMVIDRIGALCAGLGPAYGCAVEVAWDGGIGPTVNRPEGAALALRAARDVAGEAMVDDAIRPLMVSEDFSAMLEARPGSFVFLGNGASAALHNPAYDFNDAIAPVGASYFVRLVERSLPVGG